MSSNTGRLSLGTPYFESLGSYTAMKYRNVAVRYQIHAGL